MKQITIGMLGAGRATELHMNAYRHVNGVEIRFKSIFDTLADKASLAKNRYGFEQVANTAEEIFNDPEIDIVDICTPPYTHKDFIVKGLSNSKHVICEKPLCGYFGKGDDDKYRMLESVKKDLEEIDASVKSCDKNLFYAENFLFAPSILKAAEIIKAKNSKILYAKGEESLAGSSSPTAGLWEKSGGGTLMRVGCHPLSAILWLKQINNKNVHVTNVNADFGKVINSLDEYEHRHIKANPVDVEDHATVCLTFSDNTKAVVMACDSRLGGSKNYVELYCNDAVIECNLTMNNSMSTYFLDEDGLNDVEISEMLKTKCGWNNPFVADEIMRGYMNEMQNFIDKVKNSERDLTTYHIAKETTSVIYQAYLQLGK